ncbi:uncharacterized protein LOC62_04G006422 [Vanrija pseudolonga]|uniref:F-box domain-containing protein n=1 Tax=Vanrija pseudolonga TaxID=143232 RepID=A0AAF0YAL5_9TREE|nr:hypothetical protein LOC62_04G006422 [Vanrija pseudolonga]
MGSAQSRRRGNKSPPDSGTRLQIHADACSTHLNFDSTEQHLARIASDPLAPLRALCSPTSPKTERKHQERTGRPHLYGTVDVIGRPELDAFIAAINACGPLDNLTITLKSSNEFPTADAITAALLDGLDVQLRKLTFVARALSFADLLMTAQALVRFFARPCSATLEEVTVHGPTTGRPAERNLARVLATLDNSWTSRKSHDGLFEVGMDYTRTLKPDYDWAEHNRKHEGMRAENSPWSKYVLASSGQHAGLRASAARALVTAQVLLHALPAPGGAASPFTSLPAEIIHRILGFTVADTLTRAQVATVLRYAEDRDAFTRVVTEWNRLDPRQSWDAEAERRDRRNEWWFNGGFSLSHREVCATRPHRAA